MISDINTDVREPIIDAQVGNVLKYTSALVGEVWLMGQEYGWNSVRQTKEYNLSLCPNM